jgi:hypothetical protein
MKIIFNTIFVNDQDKALKVYTESLGFVRKSVVANGPYRWLTVVSPDDQNGTELVSEPNDNPAARTYQRAIFEQGIPATSFGLADVCADYKRLKELGVKFIL